MRLFGTKPPDFPSGEAAREQAKFRPSATPGLTVVAITNDDGTPVAGAVDMQELVLLLRAAVLGLTIQTETDLINEVSA